MRGSSSLPFKFSNEIDAARLRTSEKKTKKKICAIPIYVRTYFFMILSRWVTNPNIIAYFVGVLIACRAFLYK